MTTLTRAGWNATEKRPVYVRFSRALRTGKNNGVTLYDATAGYTKDEPVNVEDGKLTLYDSYFGRLGGDKSDEFRPFSGSSTPLTNPCAVFVNDAGYWQVVDVPSGDIVLNNVQEAPKPEKKEWSGGGGRRGKDWTPKELEACYNYWLMFMQGIYGAPEHDRTNEQALAYAVDGMVEISSMACKPEDFTGAPAGNAEEEPPPPTEGAGIPEDEIPFHHQAPTAGVI